MTQAGRIREEISATLNAAYGDGLLSPGTLAHRLERLFASPLIDPGRFVGDLSQRPPRRRWREAIRGLRDRLAPPADERTVLALDWSGGTDGLTVGRHPACDVVLPDPAVSRRHAELHWRDGHWVVQDLDSRNGTRVNGAPIARCRLAPGDELCLGDTWLQVD